MLIEAGTGHRILFTTVIDGPWPEQPVRATYVDDGRFMPSVVRIEILSSVQYPSYVASGHVGWTGVAEAKRRPSMYVSFLGFIFILAGALAPAHKAPCPEQLGGVATEGSGE
ncbi:hypothetical protein [Occallatibacter riparius]|uniref:Uncharacterized protein n=1 Tax=Occallatibacter riparius TaxID=1002689 RepID=A0A9J7BUF8_9BACT|nr:hypothetical protein [Occallatibacter riparius]UWZ86217.1 hypothetical protein MOP44_09785 [Occallatibacter riparius]